MPAGKIFVSAEESRKGLHEFLQRYEEGTMPKFASYEVYAESCRKDNVKPLNEEAYLMLQPKQEADPNGIDQHQPGAKLDSGKQRPGLIMDHMARALAGVVAVGTFGANKYTDNGWQEVPNGVNRYRDAQIRHELKRASGEVNDPDSGLPHDFHIAWNILAQVELKARQGEYSVKQ